MYIVVIVDTMVTIATCLTDLTDLYTYGQTQVVTLTGVLGSHNNLSYTFQVMTDCTRC